MLSANGTSEYIQQDGKFDRVKIATKAVGGAFKGAVTAFPSAGTLSVSSTTALTGATETTACQVRKGKSFKEAVKDGFINGTAQGLVAAPVHAVSRYIANSIVPKPEPLPTPISNAISKSSSMSNQLKRDALTVITAKEISEIKLSGNNANAADNSSNQKPNFDHSHPDSNDNSIIKQYEDEMERAESRLVFNTYMSTYRVSDQALAENIRQEADRLAKMNRDARNISRGRIGIVSPENITASTSEPRDVSNLNIPGVMSVQDMVSEIHRKYGQNGDNIPKLDGKPKSSAEDSPPTKNIEKEPETENKKDTSDNTKISSVEPSTEKSIEKDTPSTSNIELPPDAFAQQYIQTVNQIIKDTCKYRGPDVGKAAQEEIEVCLKFEQRIEDLLEQDITSKERQQLEALSSAINSRRQSLGIEFGDDIICRGGPEIALPDIGEGILASNPIGLIFSSVLSARMTILQQQAINAQLSAQTAKALAKARRKIEEKIRKQNLEAKTQTKQQHPPRSATIPSTGNVIKIVVKSGDTPSTLASRYGVTTEVIMSAAGINDPRRLQAGKTLVIHPRVTHKSVPVSKPISSSGTRSSAIKIVVKSGDTPSGLAARYGVTTEAIMSAAGISDPRRLQAGKTLVINTEAIHKSAPKPAPAINKAPITSGTGAINHIIAKGQTPTSIAHMYNVDVSEIMRLNNLTEASARRLQVGQKLIIKQSSTSKPAPAQPQAPPVSTPASPEPNKPNKTDDNSDSNHMIGENGTQITNKTIWKNRETERLDVENPAPGKRDGQIHYHEANNTKWYYDLKENIFVDPKTGEMAPKSIQQLLNDANFQKALQKALKFLGEK